MFRVVCGGASSRRRLGLGLRLWSVAAQEISRRGVSSSTPSIARSVINSAQRSRIGKAWAEKEEGWRAALTFYCNRARLRLGTSRITLILHVGNVLALIGASSSDIIQLRTFFATSSLCLIVFNMLQPIPLVVPSIWGLVFFGLHVSQIRKVMLEQKPLKLEEEEESLYEKGFMPHQFTPRQFKKLKGNARFENFAPGEKIVTKGHSQTEAAFVMKGSVEVKDEEDTILDCVEAPPGGWLGKLWLSNKSFEENRRWPSSAFARDNVRICWMNQRQFSSAVEKSPDLIRKANLLEISDLQSKLKHTASLRRVDEEAKKVQIDALKISLKEHIFDSYKMMVQLAVADGRLTSEELDKCNEYRKRFGITQEQHEKALEEAGWGNVPFKAGTVAPGKRMKWGTR